MVKRAAQETWVFLRSHALPEIGFAVFGYLVAWGAVQAGSKDTALTNALAAAIYTAIAAGLLVVVVFTFNLIRAPLSQEVERLQPGPMAVKAEQARLRELRGWVGLVQSDVRSVANQLRRMKDAGHYWDPDREYFDLPHFKEGSRLLLSGDPFTRRAFQAVDALDQEMHRLRLTVSNRWGFEAAEMSNNPSLFIHRPKILPTDDFTALEAAIKTADTELARSFQTLERQA